MDYKDVLVIVLVIIFVIVIKRIAIQSAFLHEHLDINFANRLSF